MVNPLKLIREIQGDLPRRVLTSIGQVQATEMVAPAFKISSKPIRYG